jgi:hypothetical protein
MNAVIKNSFTPALTLTLSPGKREQPLGGFVKSASQRAAASRGFAKTLGAFLPLRSIGWRGEGRGEVRSSQQI